MNSVINITSTSSCNRNRNSPSNRIRERIGNINHTHTSDHISKTMRIRKSIVNTRRLISIIITKRISHILNNNRIYNRNRTTNSTSQTIQSYYGVGTIFAWFTAMVILN